MFKHFITAAGLLALATPLTAQHGLGDSARKLGGTGDVPMLHLTQASASYYVEQNGQPTGPHDGATLQQMAAQGVLTADTLVWTNGMADWAKAGTVAELVAMVSGPPPVPDNTGGGGGLPPLPPVDTGGGGLGQGGGGLGGGQGGQGGQTTNPALDQLAQKERQDFGVPASNQLHTGQMHGPTPSSIPGGQLITTKGLIQLVQQKQTPFLLFDVLGSGTTLPGAIDARIASQAGSYQDEVQNIVSSYLQQATGGKKDVPLIFYCHSVQCWLSYNASLRAINAGYTNVLWYRGGIEAWQAAGMPTTPAGGGQQQQ